MSLDTAEMLSEMFNTMNESIPDKSGDVKEGLFNVLKNRQANLDELIQAVKGGGLSDDDFQEELKREKIVLETELLARQIAAKAEIQKAVNAAVDTLTGMIKAAL